MKGVLYFTFAAILAVSASANPHHHRHRVARAAPSKADNPRTSVITHVAVKTEYRFNGKAVNEDDARAGLQNGDYTIVGETTPTIEPPPPPLQSSTSSQGKSGALFMEKSSASSEPSPSASNPAPQVPQVKPQPQPNAAVGLDREFPSGKVKCSEFPAQYGAMPLNYLGFGGWSGLQYVPGFRLGLSQAIGTIHTGNNAMYKTCSPGTMCSYACPPGYQKTQWPAAQGSRKESVGGVYCNSQGFLELTRKSHRTLCESGAGGVTIKNELPQLVSICRTDYPGTENMVIPTVAEAGGAIALTNPVQDKYYQWQGKPTSAQYYVNNKGYRPEQVCVWKSPVSASAAGNWAPIIIGTGKAANGITFTSIFQNKPTSDAPLNFNITIEGDGVRKCAYLGGKWIGGGGEEGCTASTQPGGNTVIRFF